MNKRTILLIIVLMAVAMVGLVGLQWYWIRNAIQLNDNKFRHNVYEALGNVVDRLERQEIYTYAIGKFDTTQNKNAVYITGDFDSVVNLLPQLRQAFTTPSADNFYNKSRHLSFEDSIVMGNRKIKVSYEIDNLAQKSSIIDFDPYSGPPPFELWDSINEFQSDMLTKLRKITQRSQMVSMIVNQIFSGQKDPVFRINQEDLNYILKSELESRGINLNYIYGIVDRRDNRIVLTNLKDGNGADLLQSGYLVKLFPNDVFPSSQYLTIRFPSRTGFLLRQIWFTLFSSVLLVLLIVFSFYYALMIIIRQKKVSDIKNDFINNMTHEFKTPIATVSLACEALQDPGINKNETFFKRYVGIIQSENDRLGRQVEKVLQMATLEKQDFKLKMEKTDTHEIIEKVIHNTRIVVEKRNGRLIKILNAKKYALVTDQVHLINILNNLLDNANKYSPGVPEITVETRNLGTKLIISISDKGIGMSKDVLNKIFEKFYRVPTGNLHDIKGFGLGLAYVKTMIMALGGTIEVKSQPGKGSTFELLFQLKNE
jgi:two-component system, OmpR family, phosphate regulon sensor histidine kinase PhoR